VNLAQLQARIQSAILATQPPDRDALDAIRDSRRADRRELFLIYHEGYRRRLAEFICNDYPTLREHLGDESFGALVEEYIGCMQSRERNARWYASRLPDFMESEDGWRHDHLACDLARLEHALSDAFDAADADAIGVDALCRIAESDWATLQLQFHPSLRILDLRSGAAGRYAFLNAKATQTPPLGDGRESIGVWRFEGVVFQRSLDAFEALALIILLRGSSFAAACTELAASSADGDIVARIAGFMAQWFTEGMVTAAYSSETRLPSQHA
jgi:hypothetical protein